MKNFKKLIEKRNSLVEEMNQLITVAEEETRALNEEETTKFGELTDDEIKRVAKQREKYDDLAKGIEQLKEELKNYNI